MFCTSKRRVIKAANGISHIFHWELLPKFPHKNYVSGGKKIDHQAYFFKFQLHGDHKTIRSLLLLFFIESWCIVVANIYDKGTRIGKYCYWQSSLNSATDTRAWVSFIHQRQTSSFNTSAPWSGPIIGINRHIIIIAESYESW